MPHYHHDDLFEYASKVLERLEVPPSHAREVAGCLIKAELRGVDSHGLVRLPVYARRVKAGVVNARPQIRLLSSATAAALVDGDNGLGPVVGARAMETAVDLAGQHGTGFVGVRHSNHFGPAGYYVEKAVGLGCIGLAISNAPPNMAPFGGRTRFLGTNPVAVGIPADREPPLIFDASTSVVARGKIIVAAHTGERIPEGWAIDPDGHPTTDADRALAGAVLPFGGPKGSAISFIIDILCGVLTGAAFASQLKTLEDLSSVQNVGHVLAAVRTDLFMTDAQFRSRMDAILRMLKAAPAGPGASRVLLPGEIELANESRARAGGLALADAIAAQLAHLGDELGIAFPSTAANSGSIMSLRIDQPFNFLPIPTDVHFGFGVARSLPDRVRSLSARSVFVVTDPGVRSAGIVDSLTSHLQHEGIDCTIYDRVTPDSGSTLICEAAETLKASAADVVVGVGGGSALDTAKAVAALMTNPGSPLEYVGLHKVKNRPLTTIAIPTTAGTGSEVSFWSVFTDDARTLKVAIGGVLLYPTVALCDPDLTMGLPPALTASTGMDALAHAVECYTNRACQPISAALALQAIELIGKYLRRAVARGGDREARYGMLLASTMAGMAMNSTRLGLAHALAMPLGSWDLKIPHSVAIAVTLPHVMQFNCSAALERFATVARVLGEPVEGCSAADAARRAAPAVCDLADAIGIPKGLAACGLEERHVPTVVDEAMKSGNIAVNPRTTTRDELAEILRRAL